MIVSKTLISGWTIPLSVIRHIYCCPPPAQERSCWYVTFQHGTSLLEGQGYSGKDITARVTWAFTLEQFAVCGQKGKILNQNRSESSPARASRCRALPTGDTRTHTLSHIHSTRNIQSQHADLPSSIIVAAWAIQCNTLVISLQNPFNRLLKSSDLIQNYRATNEVMKQKQLKQNITMYLFQGNKYLNMYTIIQRFGVGKDFFFVCVCVCEKVSYAYHACKNTVKIVTLWKNITV